MDTIICEMPLNDKIFCAALTIVSIFIIALVDRFRQPLNQQPNRHTIIYVDKQQLLSPYIINNLITLAAINKQRCIITHEIPNYRAVVSPCGHVFDYNAIRQWLATNNTCPICKVTVVKM